MVNIPENLKYSETHEWVRNEGSIAIVGITDYAQESLGDIVFVELPNIGTQVKVGDVAGSIESAKAVGEIKIPVSGEISEVNSKLPDNPETINQSPYEKGWILKIKMKAPAEFNQLLDAKSYKNICK